MKIRGAILSENQPRINDLRVFFFSCYLITSIYMEIHPLAATFVRKNPYKDRGRFLALLVVLLQH